MIIEGIKGPLDILEIIKIRYQPVEACPLCGETGQDRAKLSRANYIFGKFSIPLPEEGILLRECTNCTLLYKSSVPNKIDLARIMSGVATDVWRKKSGTHPALSWILPYLDGHPKCILDIGASNGDLLAQLKPHVNCVSALDIVAYPKCRSIINKEYIIGDIEGQLNWSGEKYEIITAFDIFEHFIDAFSALCNIKSMITNSGRLIVETGDWTCIEGDLGDWYYANLFEHQIFWNRRAFDYMCEKYNFELIEYKNVVQKNRRALGFSKRFIIEVVVILAKFSLFQRAMLATGKGDPLRFSRPFLLDHAFVVMDYYDE